MKISFFFQVSILKSNIFICDAYFCENTCGVLLRNYMLDKPINQVENCKNIDYFVACICANFKDLANYSCEKPMQRNLVWNI